MKQNEPVLVIMAAGMGSRFGGLKQMTPIDEAGDFIIDYSLYDAWRAGFRRVAFVIKAEMEAAFREKIGKRIEPFFRVDYVHQSFDCVPAGTSVSSGRTRPLGTAHAVACCRDVIGGPFAVINADDFYGRSAYETIYRFLTENTDEACYAMVGYRLRNTVTENGSVARGVCRIENGLLCDITERTKIFKRGTDAEYTEDGESFVPLAGETIVSMNFWGFTQRMMTSLWEQLPTFMTEALPQNPEKAEFYLPTAVHTQLVRGEAQVRVLPCEEVWYGVTYHDDLKTVVEAVAAMQRSGQYPTPLWQK